jgi:hypothetical protein
LIQLPHLPHRTPSEIAGPSVLKISVGARVVAARKIKLCRAFVGNALVVSEAIFASRPDGLLIETLGVQLPAFDPGDLGSNQRQAVPEIVRAILRPKPDLAVCGGKFLPVLKTLFGRRGVISSRPREGIVIKIFGRLKFRLPRDEKRGRLSGRGRPIT